VVEYPGYADRPGVPSEQTLYQAAGEAVQLLATNGPPVYVVGESLGTGVAAYVAGHYPEQVAGVALLAPYTSLADVAQAHVFLLPVRWLICDRFPAEEHLCQYHGPVAVLVAGRDRVVPARLGRRLYAGYNGPKRLWQFPQADHETVMVQPAAIWEEIIAFWRAGRR
jgi:pimeloyl-ACP methyl ester carboxylesterase